MRSSFLTLTLAAALSSSLSCDGSSQGPQDTSDALATVDGFEVSEQSFLATLRKSAASGSIASDTLENRKKVINDLVRRRALLSRALASGYDKNPDVIQAFQRLVVSEFEEQELAKRYASIRITEDEVRAYFEKHQASYRRPEMVQAAVIEILQDPEAPLATRAESLERARRALSDAKKLPPEVRDFGKVAAVYSDDGSGDHGGDIGWLSKDPPNRRWGVEVVNAIFAIESPGDFGPIVSTERGHYVVRLIARRESQGQLDDSRRGEIRRRLLGVKKQAAREEFYQEVRESCRVWIDDDRVRSLPLADGTDQKSAAENPSTSSR